MTKTSTTTRIVRVLGLLLLAYTFFMVFTVPLGPGILDIQTVRQEATNDGRMYELEIVGHNTHFLEATPLVFIRHGETIRNATAIKAVSNESVKCRIRLPEFVPSRSWDVLVNDSLDGTMSYANGFFAEGLEALGKVRIKSQKAVLNNLHEAHLPFHFPFQPNIMESIRNLMLHVPMWFTMFLLMGISFAQSIRALGSTGSTLSDQKAVSAVRVGLWFGVLGLLTGSLWARFTWGAWWVDDPQLNGAFVTVMVYAGYLVLRQSIQDERLRQRLSGVYNLFGFLLLVVLLMILPRFTESLHPGKGGNPAFSSYDLDSALRWVFYPAVVGWMILGTWMYAIALRIERLKASIEERNVSRAWVVPLLSTGSGLGVFETQGKMPVVTGVAIIIVVGLLLWWALNLRTLKRLEQEDKA